MTLIRKVARPLLGASFIAGGVERLRRPDEASAELQTTLDELASLVPQAEQVASNPKRTAQVLGGVQVGAGAMLAIGKCPRLAALALCGVHKLNSYAEFRTASVETKEDVAAQRTTLLKNVSILGGLGLAIADLAGKPSLGWRAENLSKRAQKKGAKFGEKTSKWAEDLGDDAVDTLKAFEKDAKKSFRRAESEAKRAVAQVAKDAQKVTP
ncbi:DoxX family protein [Garicola koreensis]|uniref:Putative membrane protein YphA (DoxX/SURF4 family) n=1 Tax=Garicola koreensis TaxID=1262554 RepID=A0A7W5U1B4_9MICC|nr:DoxX family protein [Garicola koreensis]MBB3667426.1 putative membrane protein YphA (DoxX/SURF4 family) [Garicola koreensis]